MIVNENIILLNMYHIFLGYHRLLPLIVLTILAQR